MKNAVTQEQINNLLKNAEIQVSTVFGKCTTVTVKLENGFILTESSASVSLENYNEEIGKECCLKRIEDKLWELEGYRLQCKLKESESL